MIQDNTVAILSWIQYEKVKWLQNNNPEVPSLVYKLEPMDENVRKLAHVRKLWDAIIDLSPVMDVFKDTVIEDKAYALGITCIRFGQIRNCIAREIQKMSFMEF